MALARSANVVPRARKSWAPWAGRLCVATACVLLALFLPVRIVLSESALQRTLAGLASGNCRDASHEAESALDLMSDRWQAHYALGVCAAAEGRWPAAERAMRAAIDGDERNWLPHYGTAIALAGRGKDSTRELNAALRLNPREQVLGAAAHALQDRSLTRRRRAARAAPFPLPEL